MCSAPSRPPVQGRVWTRSGVSIMNVVSAGCGGLEGSWANVRRCNGSSYLRMGRIWFLWWWGIGWLVGLLSSGEGSICYICILNWWWWWWLMGVGLSLSCCRDYLEAYTDATNHYGTVTVLYSTARYRHMAATLIRCSTDHTVLMVLMHVCICQMPKHAILRSRCKN